MANITVYSKDDCTQCKFTVKMLESAGAEYEIINVDENEEAREYVLSTGENMMPLVVTANGSWNGFKPSRIKSTLNS